MRKIDSNSELMTTREVGEVLGVAVRTVQLWVESGVLPAWRTAGGHRRIARSAVERLTRERSDMLVPVVHGQPAAGDRPLRLLVVEDDADLRQLFSMVVEGWSFPVELSTASDGFQGLVRIGQWMPDMVVTDLNMPGMNGFEMVRSLRAGGVSFVGLQVVVMNIWATWCAPCVLEMPTLAALQKSYAGKPVKVVTVSVDQADDLAKAQAFIAKHAPLDFYIDRERKISFVLTPPAPGMPTTVIYGPDGMERARLAGEADWTSAEAKAVIDAVLGGG